MTLTSPTKVLITGGAPAGGLSSFAEALRLGFAKLGIAAEVVPPRRIFTRWRDLRDPDVLKILSTTAVFAAPFGRRTLCVAHGFPRADVQGWPTLLGILLSLKIANRFSRLVAVSHYAAVHLRAVFNLRVDAVIHNPLHDVFLQSAAEDAPRDLVTYVGRLHPCKGLDRIFPAICALLDETPSLRACLIGDGELRTALEAAAAGNPRIEFTGPLPPDRVRARLCSTKVFISACETEALGIAYLEALSQGCVVAMPACGGGLEIAPELIGNGIHLFSESAASEPITNALRRALVAEPTTISLAAYSSCAAAKSYLEAGSCSGPEEMSQRGSGR